MNTPQIGFIGIGLMGSAMCNRLLDTGHDLAVLANKTRSQVDALCKRGAREAKTARDLAAMSDIVMICVDTSASVEARIYGPDGVIAGLREKAIVIDFGTSMPASTQAIEKDVARAGAFYLDAPLGRTPAHAVDGLLNIMCAGDAAAFERIRPVLQDLGENVFHLGSVGTGHVVKLINNFVAQNMANALAEAFAMADKAGVERQKLYDVMAAGPLHSGMMDFIKAYAIDGNRDMLAFSIGNARKDVACYAAMAESLGVESVMVTGARLALGLAVAAGRKDLFVATQVDLFEELFGRNTG